MGAGKLEAIQSKEWLSEKELKISFKTWLKETGMSDREIEIVTGGYFTLDPHEMFTYNEAAEHVGDISVADFTYEVWSCTTKKIGKAGKRFSYYIIFNKNNLPQIEKPCPVSDVSAKEYWEYAGVEKKYFVDFESVV